MIFHPVSNIKDKDEFIELINIYYRLVEVMAERNRIPITNIKTISDNIVNELSDMGIITGAEDLPLLKKVLDKNYDRFINAVSFYINNSTVFGTLLDKLNNKKRAELQSREQKSDRPIVVDFFAGAGGLSLGFIDAGYRICFANDFEDVCIRTYKYNHPEIPSSRILQADIRKIVDNIPEYIKEDVDVVIGGPPCQGFSSANQQRIIDDPRNELYKYFIKAVTYLLPKIVVMENVRGMLKVAEQVVEDYRRISVEKDGDTYSYDVAYKLLNSADFSVAQNRERLIYIAVRNDIATKQGITPSEIFEQIELSNEQNERFLLRNALEAIKPLDAPRVKNQNEIDSETCGKKIDVNSYTGTDNKYLELINFNRDMPIVYNHKARYVNDINYDIYKLLNQGDDAADPKIADIMPYAHRLHCFKDKYYKLIADRPSRTITAHLRMDCHSHIHPFQIRALTPREAARCQSFPDDYFFLGAYLKTYMQIGNAVPPIMAYKIATILKQYLS